MAISRQLRRQLREIANRELGLVVRMLAIRPGQVLAVDKQTTIRRNRNALCHLKSLPLEMKKGKPQQSTLLITTLNVRGSSIRLRSWDMDAVHIASTVTTFNSSTHLFTQCFPIIGLRYLLAQAMPNRFHSVLRGPANWTWRNCLILQRPLGIFQQVIRDTVDKLVKVGSISHG